MDINEIYNGLTVRINGYDGIYEIIKIDSYTNSAWCREIETNDLREHQINQLKRL